ESLDLRADRHDKALPVVTAPEERRDAGPVPAPVADAVAPLARDQRLRDRHLRDFEVIDAQIVPEEVRRRRHKLKLDAFDLHRPLPKRFWARVRPARKLQPQRCHPTLPRITIANGLDYIRRPIRWRRPLLLVTGSLLLCPQAAKVLWRHASLPRMRRGFDS